MRFQVERTRSLFAVGRALVPRVPRAFAVDIDLFSRGGLAILDRIEARKFDVLGARPALGRWTKVRLLGRAVLAMTTARLLDGFLGRSAPDGALGAPDKTSAPRQPEGSP